MNVKVQSEIRWSILQKTVCATLLLLSTVSTIRADFYVAPTGSDQNDGSDKGPFLTLERARDAVRELKRAGDLPPGGITVWLRAGNYVRTNALEFTGADSGTAKGPIVWQAYRPRARQRGGLTAR